MARVVVVGDGPAGLSAALFLAKNGHDVVVYAQDQTPMHYAFLHNYLGVPDILGEDFQRIAREQVTGFGAELRDAEVTSVARDGEGFLVSADGADAPANYVVLAGGKAAQKLATQLGAQPRAMWIASGVLVTFGAIAFVVPKAIKSLASQVTKKPMIPKSATSKSPRR
jgi:thioredoxin reductase (NADPH)